MTRSLLARRILAVAALALVGCGGAPRVVEPAGPGAARIADLFWLFVGVTTLGGALTIGVLLASLPGRRGGPPDAGGSAPRESHRWIIAATAGTTVAIFVLMLASARTGAEVATADEPTALTIDVRGHQFWWEVRYPDHQVVSANELHIPVGRPTRLRLTSADVIHSFWVPDLHGKMDMIPGETNIFWVTADRPGVFRGFCTEFCGMQHALMQLHVIAEPPEAVAAWLAARNQPAAPPDALRLQRGLEVYHEAACAHCHAIQGVTPPLATGVVGPDLTHFASRLTIGAGTMANNRGYLTGWLLDPQQHKPGNRMPPATLDPDDMYALLDYLESLR